MHFAGCSVVPAKSEHAVQAAVFVFELAASVSAETLKKIIDRYESTPGLKELFPRKSESKGMAINVGPEGIGVRQAEVADGVTFERVGPDGKVELALSLQGNIFSFTCNRYTRWRDVSKEVFRLMGEYVLLLLPQPGIAVIGLQYVDEFFVSGDRDSFRPSMLFSNNSRFLPPFSFDQQGPWHSHSGWFEENREGVGRLLNNVNIGVIAQPERLVVQIISAQRLMLPQVIASDKDVQAVVEANFEMLHRRNKELLGNLLNEAAKESIHLEDPDAAN